MADQRSVFFFFLEIKQKRKVYGHQKQGQVTWEDQRDAVHHYREKIHAAKSQLDLKMASTVRDSNKGFCKYINSKRRSRDKIVPLVGENDHLRNIDMDKAEIFNVFFISVSNTDNISVFNTGTLRALSWRIVTAGRINSQPTLNLYGIWCSSWMHISLWGLSQGAERSV